eukprot:Seg2160.3 transcript_id=Seg2160.3/GoldUCD/mRNA.D3Y31 product="Protein downstream neighbor of Son" protein_id=Seg2160.3/GoldUCD/D3Y31
MDDKWSSNNQSKLKLKIKKRKSLSENFPRAKGDGKPLSPLTNIGNGVSRPKRDVGSTKRKNPFQSDGKDFKRSKYIEDATVNNKDNEYSLFKLTRDKENVLISKENMMGLAEEWVTSNNNRRDDDGKSDVPQNENKFKNSYTGKDFPTDWTLKTKLKLKSDSSFSWCTNLKSSQSSLGVVKCIRCCNDDNGDDFLGLKDELDEEEKQKIDFRKSLSYWIHPNLPCIPNFPLTQPLKPVVANICKDSVMQSEIMANWVNSFQSVFTLVKCGFCPYFYMCCQKFVGLFIGASVAGAAEISAIITPTTRGVRELLKKEGIEFEMPHFGKVSSNEKSEDEEDSNDIETESNTDETDEDFLSSIGLHKKNFSSIEEQKFADEISKLNAVDNRPQSTVLVKGSHVNALFNFLLNSNVIIAQSGAYQGVPPTLLAPVAFEGACLQTLKYIQGAMKIQEKGGMKQVFGLEISGPLLPTHFYNLCNIIKTSNSSFDMTTTLDPHSNALNLQLAKEGDKTRNMKQAKISGLGISKNCLNYLQGVPTSGAGGLAVLKYADGEFEWKNHSM